jgi:hypothetical protein
MAGSAKQLLPWLTAAVAAGCVAVLIGQAGNIVLTSSNQGARAVTPTRTEAEALLTSAWRLAQAHNYVGLCQTIAQDQAACRQILQWADRENIAPPSMDLPAVLGATTVSYTATTQGAEVLHIQGIRADGTVYQSDFSAVRTPTGQIQSQNAVYWFSNFVAPSSGQHDK